MEEEGTRQSVLEPMSKASAVNYFHSSLCFPCLVGLWIHLWMCLSFLFGKTVDEFSKVSCDALHKFCDLYFLFFSPYYLTESTVFFRCKYLLLSLLYYRYHTIWSFPNNLTSFCLTAVVIQNKRNALTKMLMSFNNF